MKRSTRYTSGRPRSARPVKMSPTNSFWGTRFAILRDPFGHRWILNGPLSASGAAEKPKAGAEKKAEKK